MIKTATMEYRVRDIPDDLWWRFKSAVALNKTRINKTVIELIQEYVDRQGIETNGIVK